MYLFLFLVTIILNHPILQSTAPKTQCRSMIFITATVGF